MPGNFANTQNATPIHPTSQHQITNHLQEDLHTQTRVWCPEELVESQDTEEAPDIEEAPDAE